MNIINPKKSLYSTISYEIQHINKSLIVPFAKHFPKHQKQQELLEYNRQKINKVVLVARHQNKLYRSLQFKDQTSRQKIKKIINSKLTNAEKNNKKNIHQQIQKFQKKSKYHEQIRRKYQEYQQNLRRRQNQQSQSLRKAQLQYFQARTNSLKKSHLRQRQAKPSYEMAIKKINSKHLKQQKYSRQSQKEINLNLNRQNSNKSIITKKISQTISSMNSKVKSNIIQKHYVYEKNEQLKNNKHLLYIQSYDRKMRSSERAFSEKQRYKQQEKSRISKYLGDRSKRWQQEKSRIQAIQLEIAPKCQKRLSKQRNSSASLSINSSKEDFWRRQSAKASQYRQRRQLYKKIKENKDDNLLSKHISMSIRNSAKIQMKDKIDSISSRIFHATQLLEDQHFGEDSSRYEQ